MFSFGIFRKLKISFPYDTNRVIKPDIKSFKLIMKKRKYTKYIALFVILVLTAVVYIDSFEDIEQICSDKPGKTEL